MESGTTLPWSDISRTNFVGKKIFDEILILIFS